MRLDIDVVETQRLVPRIIMVVTGRNCAIDRIDYQRSPNDSATSRLILELSGSGHLSPRLPEVVRRMVGVVAVQRVDDATDGRSGSPVHPTLRVDRARASVRLDGTAATSDITLALRTPDNRSVLAAGEGAGLLDAMSAAFRRGVAEALPDADPAIEVCRVDLRTETPPTGLGSKVRVELEARVGHERRVVAAVDTDVVSAGLRAFCTLYGAELSDSLDFFEQPQVVCS